MVRSVRWGRIMWYVVELSVGSVGRRLREWGFKGDGK